MTPALPTARIHNLLCGLNLVNHKIVAKLFSNFHFIRLWQKSTRNSKPCRGYCIINSNRKLLLYGAASNRLDAYREPLSGNRLSDVRLYGSRCPIRATRRLQILGTDTSWAPAAVNNQSSCQPYYPIMVNRGAVVIRGLWLRFQQLIRRP
jgi:hypothetical protein